jgi:ribosomal protein L11 methyltransferase
MKPENWLEVIVTAAPDTIESISNFLFEAGSVGIVEQEQLLHAYFPAVVDGREIKSRLSDYLDSLQKLGYPVAGANIVIENVADRDWNSEWKKGFKPVRISDNVLVKPTWCDTPDDAPPVIIAIDPEMAFGTGTHATTSLCMKLLDNHAQHKTVLDAGTGTGILAILAAKEGAIRVCAVDNDPIATSTAKKNAGQNGTLQNILFFTGSLTALQNVTFDVIVANINRTQIIALLPDFNRLLNNQGLFILSGILDIEESLVTAALAKTGFKIIRVTPKEEWLAFECEKEL